MPRKPRLIGYIRVSRTEQNLDLQRDALQAAGCHIIYEDKVSGTRWRRKGLTRALAMVGKSDRLAVWRIDRLGRTIVPILAIIERLEARGASVVSLSEGIDTATENGKLQAIFLAVVAQMEHAAIRRRTKAGVDAAMRRGKPRGARRKLTSEQTAQAATLMRGGMTASAVAARYAIGRATLFRSVRAERSGRECRM